MFFSNTFIKHIQKLILNLNIIELRLKILKKVSFSFFRLSNQGCGVRVAHLRTESEVGVVFLDILESVSFFRYSGVGVGVVKFQKGGVG